MSDRNGNNHDRFMELAALATAEALTENEAADLAAHLRQCESCREVSEQYRTLATEGLAMLAGAYAPAPVSEAWDEAALRRRLIRDLDETDAAGLFSPPTHPRFGRAVTLRAALAAALMLVVAVTFWRLGKQSMRGAKQAASAAHSRIEELLTEKRSADAILAERNDALARLQADSSAQAREIERIREQLRAVEGRQQKERASARAESARHTAEQTSMDEQLRRLAAQRDRLAQQLQEASQAAERLELELAGLRSDRDLALERLAPLETKAHELAAVKQDQERRLLDAEKYLAADRDIRELMGARKLYIADVFDVDSASRTRQPFGRIFYTLGKTLIFYAFDLDRQPGVRSASAFQVWGEKQKAQGERSRPLNLGLLYLDSESNRRWTLRFDDPQTLAEIDAVFVTVEPQGGSTKPTGKPFLFAMLRREINHP